MKEAPIYTQGFSFFTWLVKRMEKTHQYPVVTRAVVQTARELMEALTLAFRGFDTPDRAWRADEALALLRFHVRAAFELDLLSQRQYLYAAENMDSIGRQLGGWRKALAKGP